MRPDSGPPQGSHRALQAPDIQLARWCGWEFRLMGLEALPP